MRALASGAGGARRAGALCGQPAAPGRDGGAIPQHATGAARAPALRGRSRRRSCRGRAAPSTAPSPIAAAGARERRLLLPPRGAWYHMRLLDLCWRPQSVWSASECGPWRACAAAPGRSRLAEEPCGHKDSVRGAGWSPGRRRGLEPSARRRTEAGRDVDVRV
jgi:hypothetical protein